MSAGALAEVRPADPYAPFREELFSSGWLLPGQAAGIYLRSERFEGVVRGLDRLVSSRAAVEEGSRFHFPPVMASSILQATDYVRSFPQLSGVVACFEGAGPEHLALLAALDAQGGPWSQAFRPVDLALCPAACHPLYPTQRGRLQPGGRRCEVFGQCFRREPSPDPARMQAFRQHEVVYLGSPGEARAHRDQWVEEALALHRSLGLEVEAVLANDPFFGRPGAVLAADQRAGELKVEVVAAVAGPEPTAITSANCHLDHFGAAFEIVTDDHQVAHSACIGYGVERVVLALLRAHGFLLERWPRAVRRELGL